MFFFEGEPYLWARLDRKPTKQADKKFKKYQFSQKTCKGIFPWPFYIFMHVEDAFFQSDL